MGIAYQTWNKPLGIDQTAAQMEYDLAAMRSMGVTSLRVDLVWREIEPEPDRFDFTKPDLLFRLCKKHGMKVLPLIGFQWPPPWFPETRLLGLMPAQPGGRSVRSSLMNYGDPWVQDRFSRFIRAVVARYKGNPTVAAWILGNELGYHDHAARAQAGYDPESAALFRAFLRRKYQGDLARLQRAWGARPRSFEAVDLGTLRLDQSEDLVRPDIGDWLDFRRRQIAEIVALGSRAAKEADPRALRTYSAVGVIVDRHDAAVSSEDPALIARRCQEVGAPLSFISLNVFPNRISMEAFNLGIAADVARAVTGLPVAVTEFGSTSTEEFSRPALPAAREEKQARFVVDQLLEAVVDRMGPLHVFTWNDRRYVEEREKGFGMVREDRRPKALFDALADALRRLGSWDLPRLQADLLAPERVVAILAADPERGGGQRNSQLTELWMTASLLRRLDIPYRVLTPADLKDPARLQGVVALFLCRQGLLSPEALADVRDRVLSRGIHVVAMGALPAEHRQSEAPAGAWRTLVTEVLGISDGRAIEEERDGMALALFRPPQVPGLPRTLASFASPSVFIAARGGPVPLESSSESAVLRFAADDALEFPIYLTAQRGAARSALFTFSLRGGFDFPLLRREVERDHAVVPAYNLLATALRDLLVDKWKLDGWNLSPNLAMGDPTLLERRLFRLRGGGQALFAQHLPPWNRGGGPDCTTDKALVRSGGLAPGARLVDVLGGEHTADAQGQVAIPLMRCRAALLVSADAAPRYRRRAPAPPPPPPAAARRAAFPGRVYALAAEGQTCLLAAFAAAGWDTSAKLGVRFVPETASWATEPARGVYARRSWEPQLLASDLFSTLAIDGATPADLPRLEAFLARPGTRAVVRTTGAEVGLVVDRRQIDPARLLRDWPSCDSSAAALERFLR